jgi:hypothetical protein
VVRTAIAFVLSVRFTVEQIFLTTPRAGQPPRHPEYHVVEADSVDAALEGFLSAACATLVGEVQKFPGFQAVATARAEDTVFAVNLLPGSDIFHRTT